MHNSYPVAGVPFKNCLTDEINKLKKGAVYLLEGTGPYNVVNGHHPIMKIMFIGDSKYKWREVFSVSTKALSKAVYGVADDIKGKDIHSLITGRQGSKYAKWRKDNPGR